MGTELVDPTTYKSIIGSLRYLTNTRPDINYAIRCMSRFMEQPKLAHLQVAKRILQYFKGSHNYGFFLPSKSTRDYYTYVDAN